MTTLQLILLNRTIERPKTYDFEKRKEKNLIRRLTITIRLTKLCIRESKIHLLRLLIASCVFSSSCERIGLQTFLKTLADNSNKIKLNFIYNFSY